VRLDPAGVTGPTRGQARSKAWRSTSHGFYVPSAANGPQPEQRILEQSMRLPAEGAVTGWAAARLHGGGFFDGLLRDGRTQMPVPLCVGPAARVRADQHITVTRDRLDSDERVVRYGIPCVKALRAGFDCVRTAPDLRDAVVAVDMLAAAEIASIARLCSYASARPKWRGVPQVRRALDLASEDSRSPNETRMRLVWLLDARLPRPRVNTPVYDLRGRLLGVVDLLDEDAGVVGEFDGADHRTASAQTKDVRREDRLRRHGLEVFRVTGQDLREPRVVAERMLTARSRARWEPSSRRRWTIDDGLAEPSLSLDEILDRRDLVAEMHAAAHSEQ
jgi:hypothetical protein